ncbi:MAG: phosphate transport system substrate-binding protein [Gaiellales bacterium]|jgi:ABC-type phosphate transport system substrate-binding protein|nr:phosphate transport system substrate-binding protein [Gaiellales bacterium]
MPRPGRRSFVILSLAAGLSIALASSAFAGGGSVRDSVYRAGSITVAPAKNLGNNQFVKVSWKHYGTLQVVFFRQCTAHPTKVARDCTAIYPDPGFTNSDGAGALFEHVNEGDVRSESGASFQCTSETPCSFGVFTGATLASGKLVKLLFAPTPDGCPAPSGAAIAGGGADQANRAMFSWGVQTCQPPLRLGVNYIPANSQDGRENFVHGLNDFAITGTPFSDDELAQLSAAGKSFQYAPITASGLVLAYKVFNQDPAHSEPGAQVSDLKLTPQLVAKIFTGQITNWQSDPEINGLNPGHVFPPTVRPLVRGDHSAANLLFTSWLTAAGGAALPADWPGASADYPLVYLTQNAGIVGGDALADAIADPNTAGNSNDYFSTGYIGFVDSSEAAYYGLPVARIQNAAGKFVTATPKAIESALAHSTPNTDGVTLSPDFGNLDPKAYPMPIVDYVTAPTTKINTARGTTLRGFLHYAATVGQHHLPAGYTPLPPAMATRTLHVIEQIPGTTPLPGGGGSGSGGGGTQIPGGSTGYPSGGGLPPTGSPATGGPATPPPTVSKSSLVANRLQSGTARLVLPILIALSIAGVLGGFGLLGAASGRAGVVARALGLVRRLPLVRRAAS